MTFYKQCKLLGNGSIIVTWIPEEFAKKGKCIQLKEIKGWVNGYLVEEVYNTRLDEKVLIERSEDYKHTRKASDV
jgi:hypothetical protein